MDEILTKGLHELNKEVAALRSFVQSMQATSDERDRRYLEKFDAVAKSAEAAGLAAGTAVAAALAAQEKAVAAAFAAQEKAVAAINEARDKAILKAEEALRDYKTAANEFRGTLSDLAARLLSRTEAEVRFLAVDKVVDDFKQATQITIDQVKRDVQVTRDELRAENVASQAARNVMFEGVRKEMQAIRDELRGEISDLRESRSAGMGHDEQRTSSRLQSNWLFGAILGGLGLLIGVIEFILRSVGK